MRHFFKIITVTLLLIPQISYAYNFLYIHPTTGEPIGWEPGTTIHYYLDPGPLGRLTNEQAHTLLKEAMKIWENASPNADVPHFEFAGYLPEDVDGTNYGEYVSLSRCYEDDLDSCPSQAQKDLKTVIVFDEDSSILKQKLCAITPCSALAGPFVFSGSSSNPENITQGIYVLGSYAGLETTKINLVMGLMLHEVGHLLGLGHTVINENATLNDLEGYGKYIPTMYYAASSSNLNAAKSELTLNPDDIAGISVLYPSPNFNQNTAIIEGQILTSDEGPMPHVNVVARDINDPLCNTYSYLSGRQCEPSENSMGQQICREDNSNFFIALPPGTYTLEVEEIAGVNLARTYAPGLINDFIFGDAEFWNENDQSDESNVLFSSFTLMAGERRGNMDIILNNNAVTDDRIRYLSLDNYTHNSETTCSDIAPINYASLIDIDESNDAANGNELPSTGSTGGCSLIRDLRMKN